MKIVKVSDVKAEESLSKIFTGGKVHMQKLIGDKDSRQLSAANVIFSPGSKNLMHTHTTDQILYVIKGKGIVANGKEEQVVMAGTMIFFPAGEPHWHGATKDGAFEHISIMPPGETRF